MPKHTITWRGISSADFGVITQSASNNRPKRKMDVYKIPGRNGDIVMNQNAWENIEREYEIIAGGRTDGDAAKKFREIAKWLYFDRSAGAYYELKDSSEPGYFFLAYYAGGFDVENMLTRYGRAQIRFNCRPERFLESGAKQIVASSGNSLKLTNPAAFDSRPLIELQGSGVCNVKIVDSAGQETNIFIESLASTTYIDCETMNVTGLPRLNLNGVTTISGDNADTFPVLTTGENIISWSGKVTKAAVTPRWWTL